MFSDDGWDVTDAQVVCRTLGFSTEGSIATSNSQFGAVSDIFVMDDVHCTGTESHIGLCIHNPIDNCGASEGAGVICPWNIVLIHLYLDGFFLNWFKIGNKFYISRYL